MKLGQNAYCVLTIFMIIFPFILVRNYNNTESILYEMMFLYDDASFYVFNVSCNIEMMRKSLIIFANEIIL